MTSSPTEPKETHSDLRAKRPAREEQAWQEIGVTRFAPGVQSFFMVSFLLLLVTVPIFQFMVRDDDYARLSGANQLTTEAATGTHISAIISDLSTPPDSNGVYNDFLMRLHLTDVRSALDPAHPRELLLVTMSMRNRMVGPIARAKPGDRIDVHIQDWDAVAKTHSSINGSTLDEDRFLTMDAYYGTGITIDGLKTLPSGSDFMKVWAGEGSALPSTAREGIVSGMRSAWASGNSPLDRFLAANSHLAQRTKLYEEALDDQALLSLSLRPPIQALLTSLGVGNEKATVGRKQWLFFTPGIHSLTGLGFLDPAHLKQRIRSGGNTDTAPQPDPRKAIVHFRDQLAERGIELLLVPTPIKPSIHPEYLSGRMTDVDDPVRNRSYSSFVQELKSLGVHIYDPAPLLKERSSQSAQYLATDTHWRPDAMTAVAKELASVVKRLAPSDVSVAWKQTATSHTQHGDIATMLELPDWQGTIPTETIMTHSVTDENGAPWQPDSNADVLLLGDSFANIYSLAGMGWGAHGGLGEHLSYHLKRPLDRLSRNDAGAHTSRQMLVDALTRDPSRLNNKRVVIWQFAERELALGDWKILPLPTEDMTPPPVTPPVAASTNSAFAQVLAQAKEAPVIQGDDDWLFLTKELLHLTLPPFWGEHAESKDKDPLHSIGDLHKKLAGLGIDLILLPAPPRSVIYADKLLPETALNPNGIPRRTDPNLHAFYSDLRKMGVTVIDVTDAFLAARKHDDTLGPVSCKQDSHWSPRGLKIAADAVVAHIGKPAWMSPAEDLVTQKQDSLSYVGDLVALMPGHLETRSTTTITRITSDAPGSSPLAFNDASPVLILADSHGLVFSAGADMHSTSAGFAEHVSAGLGFSVDLMAARGSGSQVRRSLARRFIRNPDQAAQKRVLIYTFAARTFTGPDGWKTVPLSKSK